MHPLILPILLACGVEEPNQTQKCYVQDLRESESQTAEPCLVHLLESDQTADVRKGLIILEGIGPNHYRKYLDSYEKILMPQSYDDATKENLFKALDFVTKDRGEVFLGPIGKAADFYNLADDSDTPDKVDFAKSVMPTLLSAIYEVCRHTEKLNYSDLDICRQYGPQAKN